MIMLGLLIGFLATFGLMMAVIGTAIVSGQRSNRAEMEQVRAEFERMVTRLGAEEVDPP